MTVLESQQQGPGQREHAVQATNNSSIHSKGSMMRLGYARDYADALHAFLPKTGRKQPRRAPLINRYNSMTRLRRAHFRGMLLVDIIYVKRRSKSQLMNF